MTTSLAVKHRLGGPVGRADMAADRTGLAGVMRWDFDQHPASPVELIVELTDDDAYIPHLKEGVLRAVLITHTIITVPGAQQTAQGAHPVSWQTWDARCLSMAR